MYAMTILNIGALSGSGGIHGRSYQDMSRGMVKGRSRGGSTQDNGALSESTILAYASHLSGESGGKKIHE